MGITEGVKVRAYNADTGEFCGEFSSVLKAARCLFLKPSQRYGIFYQIYAKKKIKRKGIKSKKTGISYTFEKVN